MILTHTRTQPATNKNETAKKGTDHGISVFSELQDGRPAAKAFHCLHRGGGGWLHVVLVPSFRGPNRFIPRRVGSFHAYRQLSYTGVGEWRG